MDEKIDTAVISIVGKYFQVQVQMDDKSGHKCKLNKTNLSDL